MPHLLILSVVNLFPSSVLDFSPHGYEVIGSVARPCTVPLLYPARGGCSLLPLRFLSITQRGRKIIQPNLVTFPENM